MHIKKRQIGEALEDASFLFQQGDLQQSSVVLQAVLKADHRQPDALHLLGLLEARQGSYVKAVELLSRAVKAAPDEAEFHNSLGVVLRKQHRLKEAERSYLRCLKLMPEHLEALDNLATLLRHDKRYEEAERYARKALAVAPGNPRFMANLAGALHEQGRVIAARQLLEQALLLLPEKNTKAAIIAGLIEIAFAIGDAEECRRLYCKGFAELGPTFDASAYLTTLNYVDSASMPMLFEEHKKRMAALFPSAINQLKSFEFGDSADRPLKIGYLSPDLFDHPVGWLLEPVIKNHNKSRFVTVLYDVHAGDYSPREGLKNYCDLWRDCRKISDDQLIDLVKEDQVDILVDLSGHTGDNRLKIFASRAAPVQVSWLGYFNTTGLPTIDWLLADNFSIPCGDESFYSEQVWRLPCFRYAFEPKNLQVTEKKFLDGMPDNCITFVSYNNLAKITTQVLAAWAHILRKLPESVLIIRWKTLLTPEVCDLFKERFVLAGGNPDQIYVLEPLEHGDMLSSYREVDIMLDTFPFSGGVTSLDALTMGVPVVTLIADRMAGRQTQAFLSLTGHPELIATTVDEYVDIAVHLANDRGRLEHLRATLFEDLIKSPLCDVVKFTRDLESAYQGMWDTYCRDA